MKVTLTRFAVLLCVAFTSCVTSGPVKWDQLPENYRTGEILFLKGEYGKAAKNFEEFIGQSPHSPYYSDAHYWAGVCALKLGDPERARRYLSIAKSQPRTPLLATLSLTALADCDYAEKKFASAATRYRRVLGRAGVQKGRILYRLGLCYNRTGKIYQARACFQEILQSCKGTKYADLAKDRLSFAEDGFCVQVGALSTREKAGKLRDRLLKWNFPAYVRLVTRGGKSLFCVRIGHFDTWEKANELAKKVKRARFDAIVIP